MNKKNLSKNLTKIRTIISLIVFNIILIPFSVYAEESDLKVEWFNILPELTDEEVSEAQQKIELIWKSWNNVWNEYNEAASWLSTSQQIASWIMNWDTIMNYLVFIVQFLSQLWLVIWFGYIVFAGYTYMLGIFKWNSIKSSVIKNAIIWIIIIIFSYAIMKTLTSIVGIT